MCSLNTRFGIVAVPTILLFHSGKPVLKFNYSVTLDDLRDFVKNNTGNKMHDLLLKASFLFCFLIFLSKDCPILQCST